MYVHMFRKQAMLRKEEYLDKSLPHPPPLSAFTNKFLGDFPGRSVVKASPSNAKDSIPGWEAKKPHASGPNNQNI